MRKVGNAESGHEAVSGCGRETLLVKVLLNYYYYHLNYYYYHTIFIYIYYSIFLP